MHNSSAYDESFVQLLLSKSDSQLREISRLKSHIKELKELDEKKSSYEKTITEQQEKILSLESQVEYLKRRLWGKSSERFIKEDPLQRRLDFEGVELLDQEKEEAEKAVQEIEAYRTRTVRERVKEKPCRKALPENLPRKEEHIYPDIENREALRELPPEITEVLEFTPGKLYVRKIIRHKYVLDTKNDDSISPTVTAGMPVLPLSRSYAGSSLLAELMINKYVHHLPFYRQIQIFKQTGMHLSASTINGWFKDTADLLRPLYYRLKDMVLQSDYIQVDETTVPVLVKGTGKTAKSYLWLVRSVMDSLVFFHYDKGSRAQKVVIPLLLKYQGALQTDGYDVYKIYENKKGVLPLGCWAHVRRKFYESLTHDKARAEYALSQISLLYSVESKADDENLSYEERSHLRTRLSYPLMVAFEKWLVNEYPKVLPKSPTGKAIRYAYENYHRLTRYHLDGRYQIDNNLIENSVRPVALGKKNFLFCGNHDAAEDAAVLYSLMGCCKAADVNFREWFVYFLDNVHSYDQDYSMDLAELLPHNWKLKQNRSLS
ncbi:MAG: IS66 family transposase [Tannerellaceae bacterium]|nr:IS66 family transposase [Tannerellaceae bacterium]